MSDDELERLKNVEVDFSRELNAATEVDPAKVDAPKLTGLRAAVSRLGWAAYRTITHGFGHKEHAELKAAIAGYTQPPAPPGHFAAMSRVSRRRRNYSSPRSTGGKRLKERKG